MKIGLIILGIMLLCVAGLVLTVPAAKCVQWEERGAYGSIGGTYPVCVKRGD